MEGNEGIDGAFGTPERYLDVRWTAELQKPPYGFHVKWSLVDAEWISRFPGDNGDRENGPSKQTACSIAAQVAEKLAQHEHSSSAKNERGE